MKNFAKFRLVFAGEEDSLDENHAMKTVANTFRARTLSSEKRARRYLTRFDQNHALILSLCMSSSVLARQIFALSSASARTVMWHLSVGKLPAD